MSEQGTETGSPQHKKKAQDKGDVVRSRELLSAVALLAGVAAVGTVGAQFVQQFRGVLQGCLMLRIGEDAVESAAIARLIVPVLLPVGMVMAVTLLAAMGVGVAQAGGVRIRVGALGLKLGRLSPLSNVKNIFSLRSLARLAKSMVPAAVMVALGWSAWKALMLPMPILAVMRLPAAFQSAYGLALDAGVVTLVWSGLDYAVEWMAWNKRMKMTKQQVKDEVKEAMGNPQVKGRIRQVQNAMRRRKVKADISRASVIITNPTHYAVALEFSFETMHAPTVLAKGRDLHAAVIREEARWAGVPMIENPPLARSLYRSVETGQSIPFELYAAVAGILAFLYQQKVEEKMRHERARTAGGRA